MATKVLYIQLPGYKPLPEGAALRIAADGAEMLCVTDEPSALATLAASSPIDLVLINGGSLPIFTACRRDQPTARTLLITDETMDKYSASLRGEENLLVDHVVANRAPAGWTINELRITLQKIIRQDIFGLEKYFAPETHMQTLTVRRSSERESYNTDVMRFAEEMRLGQYMAKLVFGITEELLMNAIYDAPVADGRHRYGELPRTTAVDLEPHEYSQLSFGCDGNVFGIAVSDPFGALSKVKLYEYIRKVLRRSDSINLIDRKKGGAGLGLFKILYSCHSLICNVQPHVKTEVIALIDIHSQVRDFSKMARSIHYFSVP